MQIVDRKEQVLRSKVIPLVKVLWKNHVISFPFFWSLVYSFRERNVPKEGGFCNTLSRESVQYMIL